MDTIAFLLIFGLFAMIHASTYGDIRGSYFFLIAPFFCMTLLRSICNKTWHFFLSHIVLVAVLVFIPIDAFSRMFLAEFMIASALYSVYTRFKTERIMTFKIAVFGFALNFAFFALITAVAVSGTLIYLFLNVSTMLILLCVIACAQIDNLDLKLLTSGHHRRRSIGRIIAVNNAFTIAFTAVLFVGAGLLIFTPATGVIASVIAWSYRVFTGVFASVFTFLARGLFFIIPALPEAGTIGFDEVEVDMTEIAFIDVVGYRDTTTVGATFVIIVVVIIFAIIIRKLLTSNTDGDITIEAVDANSHRKNEAGQDSGTSRFFSRFRSKVSHPLRRAYIKKVKGHMKRGVKVLPHNTPDVIAYNIHEREDISELTSKYEQVRYGKED